MAKNKTIITDNQTDKKIAVPVAGGYDFIPVSEIIRGEASDNYTYLHLANGARLLVSKTLLEFEHQLAGHGFIRIHQSHLVNLNMVKSYRKGDGGRLILLDGTQVEVSRQKRTELLQAISGFAILLK